ncbi:MAG TPA: response regulator [Planctomycetota bacterium]|nr:response regulator [Planctomycetota bacterium]
MGTLFHVLAVEDDDADAQFIDRVARQSPLVQSVRVLRGVEEAQAYLSGMEPFADRSRFPMPNLVLLDLKLRRISGLELLRWIRSQPALRSLSVVVLSGTARETDLNRAYELGIEAYVVKPVGLKEFSTTLTGVLVTLARPATPTPQS